MTHDISFTVMSKVDGPMTKSIRLSDSGEIIKDSSNCRMSRGVAQLATVPSLAGLGSIISGLKKNQALMSGVSGKDVVDVVARDLSSYWPSAITRTSDKFFWPKNSGIICFDHDPHPASSVEISTPEEWLGIMRTIDPQFNEVGYLRTYSTSSSIYDIETGEALVPPGGFHIYTAFSGNSVSDYTEALFMKSVSDGYGYAFITRSGQIHIRTVFDKMPLNPVWLLFEAGAELAKGLVQNRPDPEYREGVPIGTASLKLTTRLEQSYKSVKKSIRANALGDSRKILEEYIETEAQKLSNMRGGEIDIKNARAIVSARAGGDLYPDDVLYFDEHGLVTVLEVLSDPATYDKATLADPLEPEYGGGRCKAKVYVRNDNSIKIYSYAHGGQTYTLIDKERPAGRVMLSDNLLDSQVKQVDEALSYPGVELYQRGDTIVELGRTGVQGDHEFLSRDPDGVRLYPVNTHKLSVLATERVDFLKLVESDGTWTEEKVDCPDKLASKYLSLAGHWQLPRLRAVITAPLMRNDGTLLVQEGYDPKTHIFLRLNGVGFPAIPEKVSTYDIARAKDLLGAPFAEFPYVDDISAAVPMSLLLTTLLRPTLPSAPMHGFDATSPGTGKSLLVDSCALMATGFVPTSMNLTEKNNEENEKRIGAALIEGDLVIKLDNISTPLKGDLLCSAATEQVVGIRVLGRSERVKVENSAAWTATGNNLTVHGDLTRRTVMCRMDADTDAPERRSGFAIPDLRAWCREHRPEIVWAVLVLLRAYEQDGRPDVGLAPLASFEEWSRRVRDPLVYHGYADVVGSQEAIVERDPDKSERLEVFAALRTMMERSPRVNNKGFLSSDIARECQNLLVVVQGPDNEYLVEAVRTLEEHFGHGATNSKVIGEWLRSNRDMSAGGLRLRKVGAHRRASKWVIDEKLTK